MTLSGISREEVRPSPEAFLSACALAAMHGGESRLAVAGTVCPQLRDGVTAAMKLVRESHGHPRRPVRIESVGGFRAPLPASGGTEAAFFTGGVSSLFTLWRNRRWFPEDHPRHLRSLVWVEGLTSPATATPEHRERLTETAQALGCRLIVGGTNLRDLAPDLLFYYRVFFGGLLTGFGHALAAQFRALSFSSAWDLELGVRVASHPLLDTCYESAALEIRHEGAEVARLDKMEAMRDWKPAWRNLAVCDFPPADRVNCGTCEKCLRVRLQLEVLGLGDRVETLDPRPVSPGEIASVSLDYLIDYFWEPLVLRLRDRGRTEAADAVRNRIDDAHRRLDDAYLGGTLARLVRRARRRQSART